MNLDGSPKFCKFTDEYFSFSFDMLTVKIREMLKEEVKRVKGIEVSARSFVNLKPNTIECLSKIYDRKSRRRFIIKGNFNIIKFSIRKNIQHSELYPAE